MRTEMLSWIRKKIQLFTACSKIARTIVKVAFELKDITVPSGSTASIRASFQLIALRVNVVIVEFHFAEMNLAPKRYCTPC